MTKKDIEVGNNCIARIIGTDCWLVPSHTPGHDAHRVCWNSDLCIWECSCANGIHAKAKRESARCYAVNAVMVSVLANKQEYLLASEPKAEPKPESKPVPYSQRGSLNGDRSFNLMR